jgi:hypothetical protein
MQVFIACLMTALDICLEEVEKTIEIRQTVSLAELLFRVHDTFSPV